MSYVSFVSFEKNADNPRPSSILPEDELFPFIKRLSSGPILLKIFARVWCDSEVWVVEGKNEDWLSVSLTPKDSFDCEKEGESGEGDDKGEEESLPPINIPIKGPTFLIIFLSVWSETIDDKIEDWLLVLSVVKLGKEGNGEDEEDGNEAKSRSEALKLFILEPTTSDVFEPTARLLSVPPALEVSMFKPWSEENPGFSTVIIPLRWLDTGS